MAKERLDRSGPHRAMFEKNKKRILKTERLCGICGKLVDMNAKLPDPLSPCIDHIIPVSKGGHPSDIDNLQLAHWSCNRAKSDKLYKESKTVEIPTNRNLPLSFNWKKYKRKKIEC